MKFGTKFKAKDFSGKWITGGYYKHNTRQASPVGDTPKEGDFVDLIIHSGFADWNMHRELKAAEVDANTLCQSIGHCDLNGNEIFTGDIIDIHQTVNGYNLFVVGLDESGIYATYLKGGERYEYDVRELLDLDVNHKVDKEVEIVGNIHDNKDK